MKKYHADNDVDEEFGWDLDSKVGPSVPPSISSKYKKSWRSASKATRKSRVKDYATYMMEMEADERTKSSTTVLGRKKRKHGDDDDDDDDKPTSTLSLAYVCELATANTVSVARSSRNIDALTRNVNKITGNVDTIAKGLKDLKDKQQADVDDLQKQVTNRCDDLQKQVTNNASMIDQLCGFMRGMKIGGLQEQMDQTSMSEHAGRTKAVKWAVVEEDD